MRDKAKNTGSVTVEEVENNYLLLKVCPGGKHVGVQTVPQNLVHRMRQQMTIFLATDQICMAYVEWESDRHRQCARPRALNDTKNGSVMRCD